jgi:POT family proton-dependent oligopeptide transporter
MGVATLLFWMGRKTYVNVPPARESSQAGFTAIFMYSIMNMNKKMPGQDFFDVALAKYSSEDVDGAKAVASIIKVFITVSVFWALFDQSGSSWVLQGEAMDLNVLGMHVEASQVQALNPIMVMLLIPVFTSFIYPTIEKLGFKMTALRKMSIGMVLAGFSFLIVGICQAFMDGGYKLNIAWQSLPYLILTCSEVMVSITGLEFAYTQAPRSMKSTIMSFWLITVFFGNLMAAFIAKINVFHGAMYFYFYAALMLLVSGIFILSAMKYRVKNYLETNLQFERA